MNQIKEVQDLICGPKYLQQGENFKDGMSRIAGTLKDNDEHFFTSREILLGRRFLPAGRIQSSVGSLRSTTAFNCYVSGTIPDSMDGIMEALADAAETMRLGGGDGFDFSTLRPKGALIKSLDSFSSGPVSFMGMWDAMCNTIKSAGHRRGAMMAVLRVDHPDIEEFISCKREAGQLTNFNISVGATKEFMEAVKNDDMFDLKFEGVVYQTIRAKNLWDKIMRHTWEYAEPGILFIDRMNEKNNLQYCETIAATNPCGEQPLPPHGACLLGSFNLTQYIENLSDVGILGFNYEKLKHDIPPIVRMMDNVIDNTVYPLPEQEAEAKSKRRMGLGVTGVANAAEILGMPYGSAEMVEWLEEVMTLLRDVAYNSSVELAIEKGPFPLYEEAYLDSEFAQTLPEHIRWNIKQYGIRNSHLLSIAPTGTISLWAGNISSGIEPVFSYTQDRNFFMPDGGKQNYVIEDWAYANYGVRGRTSSEVTADEHVDVLNTVSRLVDSSCSKTCNVGDNVTFDEFKELYMKAYNGGSSGCTTFRPKAFGIRGAVIQDAGKVQSDVEIGNKATAPTDQPNEIFEGAACFINEFGERECAD